MITKDEFIIPQKLSLWDFYRTSLYVTLRSKRLSWLFAAAGIRSNLRRRLVFNQRRIQKFSLHFIIKKSKFV